MGNVSDLGSPTGSASGNSISDDDNMNPTSPDAGGHTATRTRTSQTAVCGHHFHTECLRRYLLNWEPNIIEVRQGYVVHYRPGWMPSCPVCRKLGPEFITMQHTMLLLA